MDCSSVSPVIAVRSLVVSRLSSIDHDPRDVTQLQSDDWFIRRFLPFYLLDSDQGDDNKELRKSLVERTAKNVENHLVWRKENKVNDTCDNDFPAEFNQLFRLDVDAGVLYIPLKHIYYENEWMPVFMRYIAFICEKLHRAIGSRRVIVIADFRDAGLANLSMQICLKIKALSKVQYPKLIQRLYVFETNWPLRMLINSIVKVLPMKYSAHFATLSYDEAEEVLGNDLPDFMGGQKALPSINSGMSLKEFAQENGISAAAVERMYSYLADDTQNNNRDENE